MRRNTVALLLCLAMLLCSLSGCSLFHKDGNGEAPEGSDGQAVQTTDDDQATDGDTTGDEQAADREETDLSSETELPEIEIPETEAEAEPAAGDEETAAPSPEAAGETTGGLAETVGPLVESLPEDSGVTVNENGEVLLPEVE